ncbi:MAG: hypothetical protein KF718_12205 [Polyangiaceae bacterium]|nr:hypothetical protein [Polyangiaceae bacterium]
MTDDPKRKPGVSGAGRSGSARSIGEELGELDFEPDALLDSLLSDDPPPAAPPAPPPPPPPLAPGPPLIQPETRAFQDDDETHVGTAEELTKLQAQIRGRSASAEVDALLGVAEPAPRPDLAPPARAGRPAPPPPRPAPPRAGLPPRPAPPPPTPTPEVAPEAEPVFADATEDELDLDSLDLRADAPMLDRATPAQGVDASVLREATGSLHDEAATLVGNLDELLGAPPAQAPSPTAPTPPAPPALPPDAPPEDELDALLDAELEPGSRQSAPPAEDEWLALPSVPPEADDSALDATPAEEPAAQQLAKRDLVAQWMARAEWLENEAQSRTDAESRSRALVVAAELWAMAGDIERAREVISEAHAAFAASPIVQRQSRHLAQADGDWKGANQSLEAEMRHGSPECRAQAAYLAAEVQRLKLNDADAGAKKIEALARLAPDDARAHVARIAATLGQSNAPPKLRLPDSPKLASLSEALALVSFLRGGDAAPAHDASAALELARRALAKHDRSAAAEYLHKLAHVPALEAGALWLAAALDAPERATRPRAIKALSRLVELSRSPLTQRSLAARALEQGDASAVSAALQGASAATFSNADRVALAALTGGREAVVPWLATLADSPSLAPLAAAAAAATAPPASPPMAHAGEPSTRTRVMLGRALAAACVPGADPTLLPSAVDLFRSQLDESALGPALGAELALRAKSVSRLTSTLLDLLATDGNERELELAAGLLHELAGERDDAGRHYAKALAADPNSEAAARALVAQSPPDAVVELLVAAAEAAGDDVARSLLLLEAALRSPDDTRVDALVDQAAGAAPSLPFAPRVAEERARQRGDAAGLVGWLRRRREFLSDPIERALDAVREAWLVAEDDLDAARTLLGEASAARPNDVALAELYERLVPGAAVERARWREEAASHAQGAERAALLLEAALEHERDGDLASAARAAAGAADAGGLAQLTAERLAAYDARATDLAESLLARARESTEPAVQRDLYERLADLDRARGDLSSALLWDSAILESKPDHLPSLRRLIHAYTGDGRSEEQAAVAARLSTLLEPAETRAHAFLAWRHHAQTKDADAERALLSRMSGAEDAPLWALRGALALARRESDDAGVLAASAALSERSNRALDAATLALRGAEAATRLGQLERARALLERTVELLPEHLTALWAEAFVHDKLGETAASTHALESLADAARAERHQLECWHAAGVACMDRLGDADRALICLEKAAEIDLTYADLFERLRAQYVAREDRGRLASLLQRRLDQTTDPEERVQLEVTRGLALAEVGDKEAAKQALAAALDENPDHVDALDAFAELCSAEGDWDGAEQAWIRLARSTADADRQVEIYRRLGVLYDQHLPNPERAELAYKEILKRHPNDIGAQQRLVFVYGARGEVEQAVQVATELLERATSPEDKRDRTLMLSRVYDEIARDRRKAEATLDRARKTWPQDGLVLKTLAEFYQRHGETAALNVLLDRAANDARRALSTGRFDATLFSQLAAVAELRGGEGAAAVTRATLAAIEGNPAQVSGAGIAAADAKLDELLAPELLTLPLRALLHKSGDCLDAAYAVDPRTLRAAPLPQQQQAMTAELTQIATRFGITGLQVMASPTIGSQCIPLSTNPPLLVLGQELLENPRRELFDFLLIRSLKIMQGRASALARTAPIDLWPVLAGYLSVFASNWQAPNVDAKKLAEARSRVQSAITRRLDDDVPVLALEVIGSIGNRASQVGTAIHMWGNRAALLATGDPSTAFSAIALGAGQEPPPADGVERVKWIVRHPEARDLAVFSVSEQYADARRRVGLGG